MAIIPVTSPTSGLTYNVKIAGSAPTPEEQQKIAAFVAQKDASYAPEPVDQAGDQTPEGLNALQRGIALDPLSRGLNLQTSKRALADALGLGSIAEAGAAGEAEAEKRIAEFQKLNPNVTLDDVIKSKSVGGPLVLLVKPLVSRHPTLQSKLERLVPGPHLALCFLALALPPALLLALPWVLALLP
jgi:hypothetical protein